MDEDTRITHDLGAALTADRRLDASDIRLAVSGGVVTLDGTVRVNADRMFAEAAAWKVRGVVGVRNNLTVA
jgi:osmotically-inducible protein OsmY